MRKCWIYHKWLYDASRLHRYCKKCYIKQKWYYTDPGLFQLFGRSGYYDSKLTKEEERDLKLNELLNE